jgi:membrane-associated phospholipid phosphatase
MRAAIVTGTVALLACLALGIAVSSRAPGHFDLAAESLGGVALPLATLLTRAGLFPVYATLCAILLIAGFVRRKWLTPIAISVVGLAVAWKVSDFVKLTLHRPRPEHWFALREPSYSYPSGHAVLATAFYGFWAYIVWRSGLRLGTKLAILAAVAVWILAIGWSRLALGVHFPSDLLGGYLLGVSALAFEIAVALRASTKPARAPAARAGAR